MSGSLRPAYEWGRDQSPRDITTWLVISLATIGCVASAALALAMFPSATGHANTFVEAPVPLGSWAMEWSNTLQAPSAKQAAQLQSLEYVTSATLGLLSVLCFLIVVVLWGQRLRVRRAEHFVHWSVGAGRWHVLARVAGESRLWVLTAAVLSVVSVMGLALLLEASFPGTAAISTKFRASLIVFAGVTAALLRWENLAGSTVVRSSRVLAYELLGSPAVIATFGIAILCGVGLLALHAPSAAVPSAQSSGTVIDTSLVGLSEEGRRERILGLADALTSADIPVGLASAGTLRGTGPNEAVSTECGRCFEGGLPMPIKYARAEVHALAPDSFRHLGMELTRGRDFNSTTDTESPTVAVVSQALANRHFERGEAVGRRLRVGDGPWLTVVGVVEDAADMTGYAQYSVYLPLAQAVPTYVEALVWSPADALRVESELLRAGFRVDATRTMAQVFAVHRWFRVVLATAGMAAMLLMAAALSVAAATEVSSRRFEIGLRQAVGARRSELNRFFALFVARRLVAACMVGGWLSLFLGAGLGRAYAAIPAFDPRVLGAATTWTALLYLLGSVPTYVQACRKPLMDNLNAAT